MACSIQPIKLQNRFETLSMIDNEFNGAYTHDNCNCKNYVDHFSSLSHFPRGTIEKGKYCVNKKHDRSNNHTISKIKILPCPLHDVIYFRPLSSHSNSTSHSKDSKHGKSRPLVQCNNPNFSHKNNTKQTSKTKTNACSQSKHFPKAQAHKQTIPPHFSAPKNNFQATNAGLKTQNDTYVNSSSSDSIPGKKEAKDNSEKKTNNNVEMNFESWLFEENKKQNENMVIQCNNINIQANGFVNHVNKLSPSLHYVQLNTPYLSFSALKDDGSVYTLIRTDILNRIQTRVKQDINITLQDVQNKEIPNKGMYLVDLTFHGTDEKDNKISKTINTPVISVDNLDCGAILGRYTTNQHNIHDHAQEGLVYQDMKIPITTSPHTSGVSTVIHLTQDTVIPSSSRKVFFLQPEQQLPSGVYQVFLNPAAKTINRTLHNNAWHFKDNLQTISDNSQKIRIDLENHLQSTDIKLPVNLPIAIIAQVTDQHNIITDHFEINQTLLMEEQIDTADTTENKEATDIPNQEQHQIKPQRCYACTANVKLEQYSNCRPETFQNIYNDVKIGPTAPAEYVNQIRKILQEEKEVFNRPGHELGHCPHYKLKVELINGAKPKFQRAYKLNEMEEKVMRAKVKELEDKGVLEDSFSVWGSPCLIKLKPAFQSSNQKQTKLDDNFTKHDKNTDSKYEQDISNWRFLTDFRYLNTQIKSGNYPLPMIHATIDTVAQSKVKSHLDIADGYYSLDVHEDSRDFLSINIPGGSKRYKRLPQGLKLSAPYFQMVMHNIFRDLVGNGLEIMIDDFIIHSKTYKENVRLCKKVLKRLKEHGFILKARKCSFLFEDIILLGHRLNGQTIGVVEEKVQKIVQFPVPTTLKQLRSFLGLSVWLKRHIRCFSEEIAPLRELLCKCEESNSSISSRWDDRCQKAFDKMKTLASTAPVLKRHDSSKPYHIFTDACEDTISYILCQAYPDNNGRMKLHPVVFDSRCLQHEKHWEIAEKEALAVSECLIKYRHYFQNQCLNIYTDNEATRLILANRDNRIVSKKLQNFALSIQDFSYNIKRIATTQNVADHLTRISWPLEPPVSEHEVITVNAVTRSKQKLTELQQEDLIEAQKQHPQLANIINTLNDPKIRYTKNGRPEIKKGGHVYILSHGALAIVTKTSNQDQKQTDTETIKYVAPPHMEQEIISSAHDSLGTGHPGITRTLDKINEKWYFPGKTAKVERFVKSCHFCQVTKTGKVGPKVPLGNPPRPEKPMDVISYDVVGPINTSDPNKFALTIIDLFTRYVWCETYRHTPTAEDIAICLLSIFENESYPRYLISDRGRNVDGETMEFMTDYLKIKKLRSTSYHPQNLGLNERFHHVFGSMIRSTALQHQSNWSKYVPLLVNTYNHSKHRSHGYTPAYLHKGVVMNRPDSLLKDEQPKFSGQDDFLKHFQQNLLKAREQANKVLKIYYENFHTYHDDKNKSKDHKYYPRQWVLTKNMAREGKTADTWIGPAEIDAIQDHTILLTYVNNGVQKRVNVEQVIPYFKRKTHEFSKYYTGPKIQLKVHGQRSKVALTDPYSDEIQRGMTVIGQRKQQNAFIIDDEDESPQSNTPTPNVQHTPKTVTFNL